LSHLHLQNNKNSQDSPPFAFQSFDYSKLLAPFSLQIRYNRLSYVKDPWNWLTMFSLVAYVVGVGLQYGSSVECFEASRIIRSVDFMSFMYLLLQYLSLSNRWGPMLPMLSRMVSDYDFARVMCVCVRARAGAGASSLTS
jgi:hypothetical protein